MFDISRFPQGTIVRRVRVDRTRTPQEVIDALVATGRGALVDNNVLATMPQGEGDEVDVYFIPTKRFVSEKEVPELLAQYGLVSDPRAQAAVHEQDLAFADEYPNCTQWSNIRFLSFDRWSGGRSVRCGCNVVGWTGAWFLSGVPAPHK